MTTGNISSLPISMRKEQTNLPVGDMMSQHCVGPNRPSAGPTLLRVEIAMLMASSRLSPQKESAKVPVTQNTPKSERKARRVCRTDCGMMVPLIFKGRMARG